MTVSEKPVRRALAKNYRVCVLLKQKQYEEIIFKEKLDMLFRNFEEKQSKVAIEISNIMGDVLNVENMNNSDDIFSEIGII